MNPLRGIILLDNKEVTLRIYQEVEAQNWQVLYENQYSGIKDKSNEEIMTVIKKILFDVTGLEVEQWKIYLKSSDSIISRGLSQLMSINIEIISSSKEHDLLLNSLIKEQENWQKVLI